MTSRRTFLLAIAAVPVQATVSATMDPDGARGMDYAMVTLDDLTLDELRSLYEAYERAFDAYGASGNEPRTQGRLMQSALDQHWEAAGRKIDAVARHVEGRIPTGRWEAETRADILIRHNLNCGGWDDLRTALTEFEAWEGKPCA